tara:strand:- start:4194 stop:4364 length:171 start_codon:yes stop_codon:yes gene_type:complete
MTNDSQIRKTINASVVEVLERMKTLGAEDRQALLIEHMENLCFDDETILLVPNTTA